MQVSSLFQIRRRNC